MSGELLCIIPGPKHVIKREDAGVRWCFGCRKHLPHEWLLLHDNPHPLPDDYPVEQLSYYEPVWTCRCSQCGKDRTAFPGTAL